MTSHRPQSILIVRLTAIGDAIHALPVLNALRRALPDAHLAWVVEGVAGDLLEGHRALDQLIRIPRRWLKSPRTAWNVRRQLRALRPDVTIDVQGLTKSAIAARFSAAPRRIGFAGCDGRELSQLLNNELVEPAATHVIDRNLELLRPLGIDSPQVEFYVPEPDAARIAVERYLGRAGLSREFAVMNPGAGWPSRMWPTDRFAAVAGHLGRRHALPVVVVWAGDAELRLAEAIVRGAPENARLAPPTTLLELAALVRRARLFISSDTGPMHLAAAVGTACVGMHGPTANERNGPYGPQHICLQEVRLTGSSRERRNATNESMKAIGVEKVSAACDVILGRGELSPATQVA